MSNNNTDPGDPSGEESKIPAFATIIIVGVAIVSIICSLIFTVISIKVLKKSFHNLFVICLCANDGVLVLVLLVFILTATSIRNPTTCRVMIILTTYSYQCSFCIVFLVAFIRYQNIVNRNLHMCWVFEQHKYHIIAGTHTFSLVIGICSTLVKPVDNVLIETRCSNAQFFKDTYFIFAIIGYGPSTILILAVIMLYSLSSYRIWRDMHKQIELHDQKQEDSYNKECVSQTSEKGGRNTCSSQDPGHHVHSPSNSNNDPPATPHKDACKRCQTNTNNIRGFLASKQHQETFESLGKLSGTQQLTVRSFQKEYSSQDHDEFRSHFQRPNLVQTTLQITDDKSSQNVESSGSFPELSFRHQHIYVDFSQDTRGQRNKQPKAEISRRYHSPEADSMPSVEQPLKNPIQNDTEEQKDISFPEQMLESRHENLSRDISSGSNGEKSIKIQKQKNEKERKDTCISVPSLERRQQNWQLNNDKVNRDITCSSSGSILEIGDKTVKQNNDMNNKDKRSPILEHRNENHWRKSGRVNKTVTFPESCLETGQNTDIESKDNLNRFPEMREEISGGRNMLNGHEYEQRAFITNLLVAVTTLCLNAPMLASLLYDIFSTESLNPEIRFLLIILLEINSILDPFIYGWRIPLIRNKIVKQIRLPCLK